MPLPKLRGSISHGASSSLIALMFRPDQMIQNLRVRPSQRTPRPQRYEHHTRTVERASKQATDFARIFAVSIKGLLLSQHMTGTPPKHGSSAIPACPPMGRCSRASLRSFAPLAATAGTSLQPCQRSRSMSPWGWLQQINRLPAAGGSTGSGR